MKIFRLFVAVTLVCFAFSPQMQAVVPPPDGGYPGFNTAEGQNALFSLTTGVGNTAIGWFSLFSNTDGSYNTALGAGTLLFNTGDETTGEGTLNTAIGTAALLFNTTGSENTAVGTTALINNTMGDFNTAIGSRALSSNTTGVNNTAAGHHALEFNTEGFANTAVGNGALGDNTAGFANTGNGFEALSSNTDGASNTAIGRFALFGNITGNLNTALGRNAGDIVTGSGNVCIGANVPGEAGVDDSTYIRNVNTLAQPIVAGIDGVTVRLSDGRLGHGVSSRRYKEDIEPMDSASEALYALKPVTFHYKKEIDPTQTLDFGLIAEEVAEINPELAVRDRDGKISNYRRDAINAMLLNEFLKEHRKVEQMQQQIEALTAGLQKVSAQLELSKSAPKTILNSH